MDTGRTKREPRGENSYVGETEGLEGYHFCIPVKNMPKGVGFPTSTTCVSCSSPHAVKKCAFTCVFLL